MFNGAAELVVALLGGDLTLRWVCGFEDEPPPDTITCEAALEARRVPSATAEPNMVIPLIPALPIKLKTSAADEAGFVGIDGAFTTHQTRGGRS